MLRVSATSWHYRFFKWTQRYGGYPGSEPKTLCSYFWTIVFSPLALWGATVGKMVGFAAVPFVWIARRNQTVLTVLLTAIVTASLVSWGFLNPHGLLIFALILGGIILGLALLFLVCVGIVVLRDRRKEDDEALGTAHLLIEFVKAKKRRVCPLIEVVDEPRELVLH